MATIDKQERICTEERIIYLLKFLRFLRPQEFSSNEIEDIELYLKQRAQQQIELTTDNMGIIPTTNTHNINFKFKDNNPIVEFVRDEIKKIAVVREAQEIAIEENKLIHKKKKYKFDNVFNGHELNNCVNEITDFIEKRIRCNKDTTLITYGGTGAGKTTLINEVIKNTNHEFRYVLYEIYLNQIYAYMNGLKLLIANPEKIPVFESNEIIEVVEKFSRKENNGINSMSSRGHIILEIIYETGNKVILIDLCGTEILKKAKDKKLIDESKYINSSLYNISQWLRNPKHRDGKCILLNIIKKCSNIILTILLHENGIVKAANHLGTFADFLK